MTTERTDIRERVASLLRDESIRTFLERESSAEPAADAGTQDARAPIAGSGRGTSAGHGMSEVLEFFDQVRRELQEITETLTQFVRGGTLEEPTTPVRRAIDNEHASSDDATDGARRLARLREQLAETLSSSAQSAGGRAGATVAEDASASPAAERSESLLTDLYDGSLR